LKKKKKEREKTHLLTIKKLSICLKTKSVPGGEVTEAGDTGKKLFCEEDGEIGVVSGGKVGISLPFVRETKKKRDTKKESTQMGEIPSRCRFIVFDLV
jgi:hypothetical protein